MSRPAPLPDEDREKLLAYLDLATRGQLGPDGVIPRVLVTVPHEQRLTAVQELLTGLPAPATELIHGVLYEGAVRYLIEVLNG